MMTWIVRARSAAEMPVVTPVEASTASQKAVPNCEVLTCDIIGSARWSQSSGARATQTRSAAVHRHEIDGFRCSELGCQGEVTLVFAVLVIDDDQHSACLEFLDRLRNGSKGHICNYLHYQR